MNKKKWSVITVAALLLSSSVAIAGVFKYCRAQPNSAATNNQCRIYPGLGICVGYCNQIVVTGKMACEDSINPFCGGTSYQTVITFDGRCEGNDCHCAMDYSSPWWQLVPNECD